MFAPAAVIPPIVLMANCCERTEVNFRRIGNCERFFFLRPWLSDNLDLFSRFFADFPKYSPLTPTDAAPPEKLGDRGEWLGRILRSPECYNGRFVRSASETFA